MVEISQRPENLVFESDLNNYIGVDDLVLFQTLISHILGDDRLRA